jgi:hypothetical protein
MRWPLLFVSTAFAVAAAPLALAQSRALQQRLATAIRVECSFTTLATGDWTGATSQASVKPVEQAAVFHNINVDEGTAEAGSELGDSFISVRYATGYLHFMQISGAGPLYVTTVFAQETENGRLKAVQIRLEYARTAMPGYTSRPEMYVGNCAVS